MVRQDYYEILGVPRDADDKTIKSAYRKIALQNHPDRNPNNPEAEKRFKEASEAYQVLSDPEKRRIYDNYGHDGLKGQGFSGFSSFEDIFSSMGGIFEEFFNFGGGRRRSGPRRGRDLQYELTIDFEEAVFGASKTFDVERFEPCVHCKATGIEPGSTAATCPTCQGHGQVRRSQGFFTLTTTCPHCGGSGRVIKDPCKACKGQGKTLEKTQVSINIPAGVEQGNQLRIAGKGEPGDANGPAGDLYIFLNVEEHEFFQRRGNDLIAQLPISFCQAALGSTISVPTLDGENKLQIPKATQPGDILRIPGKGVPHVRGYGRGDLLMQVQVEVPRHLNKRQKELLMEFAGCETANKPGKKSKKEQKESWFDKIKQLALGE